VQSLIGSCPASENISKAIIDQKYIEMVAIVHGETLLIGLRFYVYLAVIFLRIFTGHAQQMTCGYLISGTRDCFMRSMPIAARVQLPDTIDCFTGCKRCSLHSPFTSLRFRHLFYEDRWAVEAINRSFFLGKQFGPGVSILFSDTRLIAIMPIIEYQSFSGQDFIQFAIDRFFLFISDLWSPVL